MRLDRNCASSAHRRIARRWTFAAVAFYGTMLLGLSLLALPDRQSGQDRSSDQAASISASGVSRAQAALGVSYW